MKPKKSLGQNFLRDESIVEKIVEAANLKPTDFVLEIGPGEGVLTEELSKKCGKILAIELDDNLVPVLTKKFARHKNVEIIHDDILKINLTELIGGFEKSETQTTAKSHSSVKTQPFVETPQRGVSTGNGEHVNYKLIANIPYYITSAIIRLFLESECPPTEMILMVQKEVAERIVAKPGEMSILSVSVQYYAKPELLFYVDKKSFFPVPEVDSAVIKITRNNTQENNKNIKQESKKFFRVVKAGFSAKRKTLVNNLANGLQIDKNIVEEKIKTVGLLPTVRAQELSAEDWVKLETEISS